MMSLSAAKTRVMFAKEYLDSPRSDEIEPLLQAAEGFLAEVPDEEREPVLAEIADIRAALEAAAIPDETRKTSAAQGAEPAPTSSAPAADDISEADALSRAESRMRDIEQVAANDPYAGLSDDAVYRIG